MNERSEQEIRERIDTTRARMGDTIEQIGDRVNPDHVKAELKAKAREQVDEVKNNMKRKVRNTMRNVEHGVSDTGRGIWATIRENPVPAGLVGVGLAWLFSNRRSGREQLYDTTVSGTSSAGQSVPYRTGYSEPSYDESYTRATQFTGDGTIREAGGLREKASEVAHQASDRVGAVRDRVGTLAHEAQHRVADLAEQAKFRARDAERRVEDSLHENPMAAGAMALAIGVAAGMMVPESEREHRLMGRSRDRVLDKAQHAARGAAATVHEAAREAAGETARNAVDEMWPVDEDRTDGESFSEPRRL